MPLGAACRHAGKSCNLTHPLCESLGGGHGHWHLSARSLRPICESTPIARQNCHNGHSGWMRGVARRMRDSSGFTQDVLVCVTA